MSAADRSSEVRIRTGEEAVKGEREPFEVSPPCFAVVGVGASAGGLEACRDLFAAVPIDARLAFLLVQHLDPNHESLLVELLAGRTVLKVSEASHGVTMEPGHLYIIPPGTYLAVAGEKLSLSPPPQPHGFRLPFDFLLQSMASELGPRAIGVVLSGMGADGSAGLKPLRDAGGFVIVQDPQEAGFDAMPRSAILTACADKVLKVRDMPAALIRRVADLNPGLALPAPQRPKTGLTVDAPAPLGPAPLGPAPLGYAMAEIITLLRQSTGHDFTCYKTGTLKRRTDRRMAMAGMAKANMSDYLDRLRQDPGELTLLADDFLINVTCFFRDPEVYAFLASKTVPELISKRPTELPLRIWVAGCSTGEEVYSLAMVFREAIDAAKRPLKVQIFASDLDADAVARAREGVYPASAMGEVSPERIARFFTKEGDHYRVSREIRGDIVFTVHDVLNDPPFSRLDLISCRNLLIYLKPEAQTKLLSLFHFALLDQGVLLLGASETAGSGESPFSLISRAQRLYRKDGRSPPNTFSVSPGNKDNWIPLRHRLGDKAIPSATTLLNLSHKAVMEAFASAFVLTNERGECLHFTGETDRYLAMPHGPAVLDLLSLAREDVRTKLRSALQQAVHEKRPANVKDGRLRFGDIDFGFEITILPIQNDGQFLYLVCFIDPPPAPTSGMRRGGAPHIRQIEALESELESTRSELGSAIRNLERSAAQQKVINDELLSVNEEIQSTNEEMLTSKEELQSLNEELTALNSQLQETLERQKTTSNDLQNVLYSTDIATLFLDRDLNIRFFTPATRRLFRVIHGDIGRPLADLRSLADDTGLLTDARHVLTTLVPIEHEIRAESGAWYVRRILPYKVSDEDVDGVVITFADITERRKTAIALEAAKQEAQRANVGKSRFLAAASHDLRQPLQSLKLIQGLLLHSVESEHALQLVRRLEDILSSITGMLDSLLDINQIESGTVHAEITHFSINDLLVRVRNEFIYHAQVQKLDFVVLPCRASVVSDPQLLEQMIRNLVSNALKYTHTGKVLVGCRRHGQSITIEIYDTGIGIPAASLADIFNEYERLHIAGQVDNSGLGLGLSIVQRLGGMLNHRIRVRSQEGRGSVFSIEVPIDSANGGGAVDLRHDQTTKKPHVKTGTVLVIDDDADERDLIELMLTAEGYLVYALADGDAAVDLVKRLKLRPDLILSEFSFLEPPNGLKAVERLHRVLHTPLQPPVPVIIMTADMSSATRAQIDAIQYTRLTKPVAPVVLAETVDRILTDTRAKAKNAIPFARPSEGEGPTVFVVDDDPAFRESTKSMLTQAGRHVNEFGSCEDFLAAYVPGTEGCLLIDAYLPGISGVELLQRLSEAGHHLPSVMITGRSDVATAVLAMKAGATDFIEKPISAHDLLVTVQHALEVSHDENRRDTWRKEAAAVLGTLTARQKQILDRVLAGDPSKNIAADLGISQRTVENHRNAIMKKTKSKSMPALARLALAASGGETV
ncbi:chemotaxis protein CheB [Asticcacaulis sp.]|uniref:chemotaxis protein CheB n=1 Tax=Asticcacaulis sp. TaxID=1872648 RepID=UPI002608911D|nr:chemotaxis protein CheB [Asticcacaulis sp.]